MISQDDVTQQMPAVPDDGLLESVDQPASVRVVANDLLAGIPPRHHVINGAFELDSQSSWHFGRLKVRKPAVKRKPKTKADTAKPQETGCQAKTKNQGRHREAADTAKPPVSMR